MRLFGVDMWFDMVHVVMISTTGVVVAVVAFLHKCERWDLGPSERDDAAVSRWRSHHIMPSYGILCEAMAKNCIVDFCSSYAIL